MKSFVVNFKDDRLHVSVSRQPGGESQVDKVVSDSGWSVAFLSPQHLSSATHE